MSTHGIWSEQVFTDDDKWSNVENLWLHLQFLKQNIEASQKSSSIYNELKKKYPESRIKQRSVKDFYYRDRKKIICRIIDIVHCMHKEGYPFYKYPAIKSDFSDLISQHSSCDKIVHAIEVA